MDDDFNWSGNAGIHRTDYHTRHGLPDYTAGRTHPSWNQEAWNHGNRGRNYSTGSSQFEEVESLCLSKSSSDSSFGQFQASARHGPGNSPVLPTPSAPGQSQVFGGRFLSRQSSTTSTSTSSGNLADPLEKRSCGTSASGSAYEDNMETLDPRQQFDLSDHSLLDGIFRRVLEWNNAHAAMGRGRGGGGVLGSVPFPQVPPGHFPEVPPRAFLQGAFPQVPPASVPHPLPHAPPTGGDANLYTTAGPSAGRRVPDGSKDNTLSPGSDRTHVRKRRDLILPDEEDEFSTSRPNNRIPEVKSRKNARDRSGSSGGVSSLSSKQASSDSMLSSMSSMSQSQDLGWREQFNHGWREAQQAAWREQANQGWGDPYVSPWRGADSTQQMWRDPSLPAAQPGPMMMPPAYHHLTSPMMSRGMSGESMTSLGMTSPPPSDSYVPAPYVPTQPMQNPAEMMLMNLGFGGSAEGFLPERFLRDWYNKISRMQGQGHFPGSSSRPVEGPSASLCGSASNFHHPHDPKTSFQSKPSYEDLRSASDLHRRIGQPVNRSATMSASQSNEAAETPAATLPPSFGKESASDRLKEYIEAYAQNMSNTTDARSLRIRQFASSRQKSLPLYLETLTEEDEAKGRNTGYKPQDRESRLQAFLRESSTSTNEKSESQGTSSDGVSNEQSLCGSESDSLSGSDTNKQRARRGLLAPREPPVVSTTSDPSLITSRTLTLKMPDAVGKQRERLNSGCRTNDDVEMPGTPKKGQRREQRSSPNSPAHTPEKRNRHCSPQTYLHPGVTQEGQELTRGSEPHRPLSPTPMAKSPSKEHRARSPIQRAKSPSRRSKSPRHHRARSPGSELKTKTTDDGEVLKAKAPTSSFEDSSSSSSPRRMRKSRAVDTGRLSVSQLSSESPRRRRRNSSGSRSPVQKSSTDKDQDRHFHGQASTFLTVVSNSDALEMQERHADTADQNRTNDFVQICEKAEPLVSNESLEVADIFQNPSTYNSSKESLPVENKTMAGMGGRGQLEPAMVSIVLEDVDGNLMEKLDGFEADDSNHQPRLQHPGQQDELLHIPSCSSSTSLSPAPLSPVTVIEVSLDNQQDSIDTEEGTSSSKELNDEGDTSGVDSDVVPHVLDFLGEETDPNEFPTVVELSAERGVSHVPPFSDYRFDEGSGGLDRGEMRDACVEADDGNASPVLVFGAMSPATSSSSSSSLAALPSNLSDVGMQADDGRLSPLVLLSQDKMSLFAQNNLSEDFYLVADQGVQCNGGGSLDDVQTKRTSAPEQVPELPLIEMAHRFTQTGRLVKYEMSSQTESSLQAPSTKAQRVVVSSDTGNKSRHLASPQANLCFPTDLEFQHRHRVQGVSYDSASPRVYTPALNWTANRPTKLQTPGIARTPSFESEFWDFLGMEMPARLKKPQTSPVLRQEYPKSSLSLHDFRVAQTVPNQPQTPSTSIAGPHGVDSVHSVSPDSYEVRQAQHRQDLTSPSSSLLYRGFPSPSKLTGSHSPTTPTFATNCLTSRSSPLLYPCFASSSKLTGSHSPTKPTTFAANCLTSSFFPIGYPGFASLSKLTGSHSPTTPTTLAANCSPTIPAAVGGHVQSDTNRLTSPSRASRSGHTLQGHVRSPGVTEHKAVNTSVTMAPDQASETGAVAVVEESRCFFVRPLVLDSTVQSRHVDEQRNTTQVHVSLLSFNVSDYRDVEQDKRMNTATLQQSCTNSTERYTPDSDCANEARQQRNLTGSLQRAGWREIPEKDHTSVQILEAKDLKEQSCTPEAMRQQTTLANTQRPLVFDSSHNRDNAEGEDSASVVSSTSLSQDSFNGRHTLVHSAEKTGSKTGSEEERSIDDYSDKDFSRMEETRKLVLSRFLLRGSAETEQFDSPVETVVDVKECGSHRRNCLHHEHQVDLSQDSEAEVTGLSGAKAKALEMFKLGGTSVRMPLKSKSADGLNEHGANDKTMTDRKADKQTLERTTFTGTDAVRNLAFNCLLLRENSHRPPTSIPETKHENETSDQKASKEEDGLASRAGKGVSHGTGSVQSKTESIPHKTESVPHRTNSVTDKNETGLVITSGEPGVAPEGKLNARKRLLLETFANSVIEAAWRDLQRDCLANKTRLQKRLRNELRPTGVFAATAKEQEDEPIKHTERKIVVQVVSGKEPDDVTSIKTDKHAEATAVRTSRPWNDSIRYKRVATSEHVSSSISDSDEATFEIDQDLRGSTSDANSELSVVFAGRLPIAREDDVHGNEGREVTDSHVQSCEVTRKLTDPPTWVFLAPEEQTAVPHDCNLRAVLPSSFEMLQYAGASVCRVRSLSANSLNSLRVNWSGSVDDNLDNVEADFETHSSQNNLSGSDDNVFDSPASAEVHLRTHKENVSAENVKRNSVECAQLSNQGTGNSKNTVERENWKIHSVGDGQLLSQNTTNVENTHENKNPALATKRSRRLSRDRKASGDSIDAALDVADADSNLPGQLTDAKLTQLTVFGVNHGNPLRLKELDYFASSLNLTTPESELNSDADDREERDSPAKSSRSPESQESEPDACFLPDSDVSQDSYEGRRVEGYLSNISEEDGSFDKNSERAVDVLKPSRARDDSGTHCNVLDTDFPFAESHSNRTSVADLVSEESDIGIEVSLQPLPANFRPGEVVLISPDDSNLLTEQPDGKSQSDFGTVFLFDVSMDEEDKELSPTRPAVSTDFARPGEVSPNGTFLCVENRDLKSPILFTTSEGLNSCTRIPTTSSSGLLNHGPDPFTNVLHDTEQSMLDCPNSLRGLDSAHVMPSGYSPNRNQHAINFSSDALLPSSTELNDGNWSDDRSTLNKKRFRSELRLSLHSMQGDSESVEGPKLLSAAERREAYNRVTVDRSGMSLSASFSEENLSSPPLRPKRFQRSLSKDSNNSDLSPKRVKRTVAKNSPNFDGGQASSANSLQVPLMGESLVSKNALSRRSRSPPAAEKHRLPRNQSPIPDSTSPSRSHSPIFGRSFSPSFTLAVPDVLLSTRSHSPSYHSMTSPRDPSPIPNVTVSSADQSIELLSFASLPEASSGATSPMSDRVLLSRSPSLTSPMFDRFLLSRSQSPTSPVLDRASLSPNHSPSSPVFDRALLSQSQSPASPNLDRVLLHTGQSPTLSTKSNTCVADAKKFTHSLESRFSASSNGSISREDSTSSSTLAETSIGVTREPQDHSKAAQTDSSRSCRSPVLAEFRALQTFEPISSPGGSPETVTPSVARAPSISGENLVPLKFSLCRNFYSSKHMPAPQPRGRLWSTEDKNSSSTDSPVPSTPSVSRKHSSTSDSSSPLKDVQSAFPGKSQSSFHNSPKLSTTLKTSGAHFVESFVPETSTSDDGGPNANAVDAEECSMGDVTLDDSSADPEYSNIDLPTASSGVSGINTDGPTPSPKSDAITVLHLRRSRFQKPESILSLQQNSSSSEQSSSETGASPQCRFFWSSGQRTVVSPATDHESSTEHSPAKKWTTGDHTAKSHLSIGHTHLKMTTKAPGDSGPLSQAKPRASAILFKRLRESSSSPSEPTGSNPSSGWSRMSDGSSDEKKQASGSGVRKAARSPRGPMVHTSETAFVNGLRSESTGRTVRELAQQFEEKGTK